MYRDAYQRGMLTVFFSGGSKPLEIWETKTRDGYIKRFLDPEIKTMVMEMRGSNISTTYMACPKGNQVLGITMPFLVMIVKNLMKYFSFEVTILDSTGTRRRFRVSNFQSTTQILPLCTVMPIGLAAGWNQIQFNLAEFTRRAYKNQFVEVQRVKVNANIRLRRIYFTERLMSDDELPMEYKLYFPLQQKGRNIIKGTEADKENIKSPSQETRLTIDSSKQGSVKKLRKSLQTVPVHTEEKAVRAEVLSTTRDKSTSEEHPQVEELLKDTPDKEKQAKDELQDTGKEEKVLDKQPGGDEKPSKEDEEKKATGETGVEETKADAGVEKKDLNDKEESDKKPDEHTDNVEDEKKVEEATDKGEGDKNVVEAANKAETDKKPDEEIDKGEGDQKPAEEAQAN